jgi:tRNA nucleotidyltransferase (CCA-adding enzyme)
MAICDTVRGAGGRALLVGGCVRDALRGSAVKDVDMEVYGLQPDKLKGVLACRFKIDLVGEAFGIIKVKGLAIDISIPRRESKSGLGHRAFDISSDPFMSFAEAASRRDFTVNSIGFDPYTEELIDPFDGCGDLREGVLRHTSDKFSEDPLRVLRAMQFAARFDLTVALETVSLCRSIDPEGLPRERLFDEWKKLIVLGTTPSRGFAFLRECGWIGHYPELEALQGCEQEREWHPEGDVWIHTLHCMDAFARDRIEDEWEDLIVGLAVLCHDFGKPLTVTIEDGRIRTNEHESAGEAPTRNFLARLTNQIDVFEQVVPLVLDHLKPQQLFDGNAGDSAVRRLARRVGRIDRLVRVAEADQKGRPPLVVERFEAGEWLIEQAHRLEIAASKPVPIIRGRHLIELGFTPGPRFGAIIAACYEAQLDGAIGSVEEGLRFVNNL